MPRHLGTTGERPTSDDVEQRRAAELLALESATSVDLRADKLPKTVWLAFVIDGLTAASAIAVALVVLEGLGTPEAVRTHSAGELFAAAGAAVAAGWLFFRLGPALLDRHRLARRAQIGASLVVAIGGATSVLVLGSELGLVGHPLPSRVMLLFVALHLVATLGLLSPAATEAFRPSRGTKPSRGPRRPRRPPPSAPGRAE